MVILANEIYGAFEFSPKGYTRGSDIGRGQIGLPNVDPPLFLEIRLIKSHTHTGVDSLQLRSEATPEMVRGFKTREREERGIATWSGGSASAGSVILTYGTQFLEAPSVFANIVNAANANMQIAIGAITATQVTIYWKDDTGGGHTSVDIQYLIKGK